MSKKKKIIIVAICLSVIVLGAVIGIIVATRKKFDITPNSVVSYNDHTTMEVVGVPQGYTDNTTYYSNATIITENIETNKFGIYSYYANEVVVPANYSEGNLAHIDIITSDGIDTNEDIFKGIGDNGELDFYNDEGTRLSITEYSSEDSQNYGYIKEKDLTVSKKKKGIKVQTSNNFSNKKIAITSAEFNVAYIRDGVYNYEVWTLTDTDGNEYQNLYKVKNGNRVLIQTLNNNIGSNIGSTLTGTNATNIAVLEELTPIYFLKDGTPMLIQSNIAQLNEDGTGIIELTTYDINFNKENSALINIDSNLGSIFRVGNNIYFQYQTQANEKKYDFSETVSSYYSVNTTYYNLETYRLNLKTGNYSEISFDYVVQYEENRTSFNVETALIHAKKIENKTLSSEKALLINDSMQVKEIDYNIVSIQKLTDDRYLVDSGYSTDNINNGMYLIDSNYNKICYLGSFDNYFTTKDAIMLSSDETGYTYVCDLSGTIIKRYLNSEITNINDDKYYMITTEKEVDEVTYEEKYLERLGVRESTPIYSKAKGDTEYIYNNETYVAYDDSIIYDDECVVSIITRVKKVDETYTYEFYNVDGKLLRSIPNFETSNCKLTYYGHDDNGHILVYISTNKGGIGYTMVLDR